MLPSKLETRIVTIAFFALFLFFASWGFQVGDKEAYRLMVGEAVGGVVQGQHGSQQQQQHQQKRLLVQQNQNLNQKGVGEGEPPPPRGNPYAALLQATKIELLETHKNSAVAKRCV